jgi:POT family proton-dependent oligopeptide transporter
LRSFLWVFCGTAVFWMVIAQAGSVLTVFARDATDRSLGGLTIPAGWLQSATPAFMLVLAPLFAWRLRRAKGGLAGLPVKFAAGLLLAGGSFLVMAVAATQASGGERVSPVWLLLTYLVQAIGELVVAAAGIAATADVLPRRYLSHALGLWWLFASLGGGLGSQLVRLTGVLGESRYFLLVGSAVALTGLVLLARKHSVVRGLTAPAPALSSTRVPPLRQH